MLRSTPRAAAMHMQRCYTPHAMLSTHAGLRPHVGMTLTRHQLSLSQYGVPHAVRAFRSGGRKCSDSSLGVSSGRATPTAAPPPHNRTATIHVKTCVELHSFSVKLSASPRSCVKKALSISARKYGAKFSFVEVFDTVSKMPVHNWEKLSHVPEGGLTITTTPSNTRTGTLASLIEDSQRIQKLLQHVEQRLLKSEQQLAMLQQASVLHTSRSARQVVVQVIKVAAGAAQLDKRVSNTTFWKRLKDHRVPELASLLGLAEQDLRRVFDECITTCSLYAHLTPLHTLDKEVEDVVRMISPELEAVCSLECKVLAGYEKIKEIFYKEFV